MFCHKCGKQAPDDAGFCYKCGTKLAVEDTEQQAIVEPITVQTPKPIESPVQVPITSAQYGGTP